MPYTKLASGYSFWLVVYQLVHTHSIVHRIPPRELFGQYGYQTVRTSWRKTQEQTLDVCLKASYTDEEADPSERIKMLQEAAVMAQFRHPNVVRLHGIIYKENVVSHSIDSGTETTSESVCYHAHTVIQHLNIIY